MTRVAFGVPSVVALVIVMTIYPLHLMSEQVSQIAYTQKSLRSMLLKQPDFRAQLEYEKQDDIRNVDQVEIVMKRGDLYRFEVPKNNSIGKSQFVLLAYPGKGIKAIFPEEQTWSNIDEVDLDRGAFTTLGGVDIYYLTKIVQHKDSRFDYISTEEFNGYSCLKIRVANEILLNSVLESPLESEDLSFETLWLLNEPLYFFVSPGLSNLIIGATGTEFESKVEGTFYSLKNISLEKSKLSKELFQVPPNFRKVKSKN